MKLKDFQNQNWGEKEDDDEEENDGRAITREGQWDCKGS